MSEKRQTVEMYWDVGSTNSYFALKLIQPVLDRHGLRLELRPYNLGFVFRSRNYVLMEEPPEKIQNRKIDLKRWADKYHLPFKFPTVFPVKSSKALRGSIAMRAWGLEHQFVEAVMNAYWERDDDSIADYEGMRLIVSKLGINFDEFVEKSESQQTRDTLIKSTNDGISRGVFGAPTIFVGSEMFWGKDRMEFVEDEIIRQSSS
jgi:2-hydroxychromene-2-carboxylate isomerase